MRKDHMIICEASVILVRISCDNIALNTKHKVHIYIYIYTYIYYIYYIHIYIIYSIYNIYADISNWIIEYIHIQLYIMSSKSKSNVDLY